MTEPRPARTDLESLATQAARAGTDLPGATRPAVAPIYQTSVYEFESLDQVDAVSEGELAGYLYSRNGLPNSDSLAEAMATLEGAEAGLATGSGMGAISVALLSQLGQGDHLLAASELYGVTMALLREDLPRWGVQVSYFDTGDAASAERSWTPQTRAVWVETLSNPRLGLADLPGLADLAHRRGALLMVDNTFASPAVCQPHRFGADLVMNSLTKFLGGHDDLTAGALTGSAALIGQARRFSVRLGTFLAPFDAWLAVRGIKTLAVRLAAACANAQTLAERLAAYPAVLAVNYPGLDSHPQRALVRQLLPRQAGAMLSFEVPGGRAGADQVIRRLRHIPFAPSLGGVRTAVSHPGTTSHRAMPPAERARLGIGDGLIRVSVGIEAIEDIWADLEQALGALQR